MTLLVLGLIVGGILILIGLSVPRAMPEMAARKGAEVRQVRRLLPTLGVLVILAGSCSPLPRWCRAVTSASRSSSGASTTGCSTRASTSSTVQAGPDPLGAHAGAVRDADVPSKEGLTVGLEVSVLYHLDPRWAPAVFRTLGDGYARVFILPSSAR